jgi:putative ABC transport system permease protein
MWRVTLKGIAAKKIRILLTSVAVVLGVAFMTGTLVLSDTINKTFDGLAVQINSGTAAKVRAPASFKANGEQQRTPIDPALIPVVASAPGVEAAEGGVSGFAYIVKRDGKALNTGNGPPAIGVAWQSNRQLNPTHLVSGRAPTAPDEIVIDQGSADAAKFKVGDKVRVVTVATKGTSAVYNLVGIVKFASTNSLLGATLTAFELPTAQRLLGTAGKIDEIDVAAKPGVSQSEVVASVRQVLQGVGADVEVISGQAATAETQDSFHQFLDIIRIFLLIFAIIALLVGSFVIYNTFGITVAQRTREMALLRAIGASRRQVTMSVFLEGLATGLIASVVGVVLGIALASGLKALLSGFGLDIPAGSTVLNVSSLATAFVVGVLVTLLASLFPALRASRVPPVAAMRDVAIESTRISVKRVVIGFIVGGIGAALLLSGLFGGGDAAASKVGAGAIIVFFGVTILGPVIARPASRWIGAPLPRLRGIAGRLARENAMRNPKRTASTAAALMIGVGLVGFVTIFAASAKASIAHVVDSSVKADFLVTTSGFNGGLPPEIEPKLAAVDGVKIASGVRFGSVQIDKSVDFIQGIDPAVVDQLFDPDVKEGRLSDLGTDGVAVYEKTADSHHLTLGSTLPIRFTKTGVRPFTVRAIYKEQALAGKYVVSTAGFDENFDKITNALVLIKLQPGASPATVEKRLAVVMKEYPNGTLEDQQKFKASQAKQIDTLLNLIYALLLLAIVIAVFGIGVTLALSIFERTHEIGLLRAVGMSRSQVRSTVRWESVIIALIGTILGLIIGVFFGWTLVQALKDQGIDQLRLPPGQLLVLVILGAVVGTIAAWWPARRAAKLDILHAIASE